MSEITEGLTRLAHQFKGSTKFEETLAVFLQQFVELKAVDGDLGSLRYLDNAEGAQLDGLGEIAGIERPEIPVSQSGAFGFVGDEEALGFGTLLDPNVGGNFISLDQDVTLLSDNLYKSLIKAKIVINKTAMNVDDTTKMIADMFDTRVRYILLNTFDSYYYIEKDLSQFEGILLDFLPTLIGGGSVTYVEDSPLGWILETGIWSDGGEWVDTEIWID